MSKILVNELAHRNNTSALTVDSTGRILTPARPAFSVRGTGSWVDVSDGSNVTIAMATVDINVGSHYDTSTYRFTAPIAGIYQISCNIYLRNNGGTSSDSGTYGYIKFQKNGATVNRLEAIHGYLNHGDADQNHQLVGILDLAVNDYVTCSMESAGGGTSSYHGAGSSFHGYLVG